MLNDYNIKIKKLYAWVVKSIKMNWLYIRNVKNVTMNDKNEKKVDDFNEKLKNF